jgi:hypothetical protein
MKRWPVLAAATVLLAVVPAVVLAATVQTSGPSDQQYVASTREPLQPPLDKSWAEVAPLDMSNICTGDALTMEVAFEANGAGWYDLRVLVDGRILTPTIGPQDPGSGVVGRTAWTWNQVVAPGLHAVAVQWRLASATNHVPTLLDALVVVFGTTGC